MRRIVSIFGGSAPREGELAYQVAQALGAALAQSGWTVATGGYTGVMEAASRGACEAGGHVIGVTCSLIEDWKGLRANPWVKEELKFDNLRERLGHLVEFCDAALALPGGIGTLSEVALTWNLMRTGEIERKPLVLVGQMWSETVSAFIRNCDGYLDPGDAELVTIARDGEEAMSSLKSEHPGS